MRIAIIGSGISGLGAAYLLNRHHEVRIYERNGYIGGHSNTVDAPRSDGKGTIPVDTGFIVFNERTYPNLLGLFDTLDVPVKKTDMSFAVSVDQGRLEYGGSNLAAIFAQRRNIFKPGFYRMLNDIVRFYRDAPALLNDAGTPEMTLGEFIERGRYGKAFARDHLLPMAAAIWSCSTDTMRDFPARSFVRFFVNHGLFELKERPQWWTVDGGSREYVRRITATLGQPVMTGCPARKVVRTEAGVLVHDDNGAVERYDRVVFACHGDEAYQMLADQSDQESAILSRFTYQPNEAILHTDAGQMPRRKRAWSSWNYMSSSTTAPESNVAVTYWMNSLQSIGDDTPLFVTLNPIQPIDAGKVIDQFVYDHPVFDAGAVSAQAELPSIQGNGGVWFCGSYCGYGFHEDGLASATAVAMQLGADIPWGFRPHQAMKAVLGPDLDAARVRKAA